MRLTLTAAAALLLGSTAFAMAADREIPTTISPEAAEALRAYPEVTPVEGDLKAWYAIQLVPPARR